MPDWTIEKCTSADKEGVYDLLKRAFFKYEPLTCDLTDHPPMDDLFAVKMIAQGHSYKAVLPTGKIVGVVINVHFPDIPDDEEPPTTGRISQIFQLFDFLERETGHLTKGLLEVHILTTDPDFTRQGMAKALIRASEDLARNNNLRGLKMACSSAYSAQLARGLNYKEVYSLAYCDYKDEKGNIVFFPPEIHSHMRLYIKEFNN